EKLKKQTEESPYDDIVSWFFNQKEGFELLDDIPDADYKKLLDSIPPLDLLLKEYQPDIDKDDVYFEKEFVLWALVEFKLLSKDRFAECIHYDDPYVNFITGL